MRPWILFVIFGLVCVGAAAGTKGQTGENVDVRSGINHGEFDRLLKKYVNEQGLVNYGAWKQNKADLSALDEYLKQFAPRPDNPAQAMKKLPRSSMATTLLRSAGSCRIILPRVSGS